MNLLNILTNLPTKKVSPAILHKHRKNQHNWQTNQVICIFWTVYEFKHFVLNNKQYKNIFHVFSVHLDYSGIN